MDPNLRWPLGRNVIRRNAVSNTFGMVRHNANGTKRPHQGWDFEALPGTPCFAIADGTVALLSTAGDYGNVVVMAFPFAGGQLYAA
ncbi:MAG TPA: hypothetical protein VEB68_03035 [Croceibacterium sp.]|nr:hypothetical protein [Croceibacterium sp.]